MRCRLCFFELLPLVELIVEPAAGKQPVVGSLCCNAAVVKNIDRIGMLD